MKIGRNTKFLLLLGLILNITDGFAQQTVQKPVIVITDLYHPYQDPGDNLDLILAYALPNIDLKAVLLDCHEPFRHAIAEGVGKGLFRDSDGPREPGVVPVQQLNYIFDRNIPYGVGPFYPMQSIDDKMETLPVFQQSAVDLLVRTLQQSDEAITIISFGSLRILAVANNRFPELLKSKVKEVHISAGTSNNNSDFLEWNVALDTNAFVSVLRSDLPVIIYPCAAGNISGKDKGKFNAFVKDSGNTYYHLNSLSFINQMNDKIKHYIDFVLSRTTRSDYLSFLDTPYLGEGDVFERPLHVWETAVWMQVAGLKLIRKENGKHLIVPADKVEMSTPVLQEMLIPCDITVKDSGIFSYTYKSGNSQKYIYFRKEPEEYEFWMNQAIPVFYNSYINPFVSH